VPRSTTTSPVRFESLAFQVEPPPGATAEQTARLALQSAFPGETWVIYPLNTAGGEFEAVPVARKRRRSPAPRRPGARQAPVDVPVGEAWDLAYRLRARPEVVYAEPLFEADNTAQHPRFAPTDAPRAVRAMPAARTDDDDPGTETAFEWSLDNLRVPQAWALFQATTPGDTVIVGHPDTGYTKHPEILGPHLVPDRGFDFEDDDPDPLDPLVGGFLRNPGRGTGTSSVIMSPRGLPPNIAGPEFVSGVAPGATLIPIRTTESVVLFSMSNLTRAIRFAIDKQVHVVSISLGGPFPSTALHNAVRDAEQAGVIVCCAAGNEVRFVVFPAAFDEVIAVAASRIDDAVWPGSCRGPAVDITAPGSSVWRAHSQKQDDNTVAFDVERGSGTSFAVAETAALAALWLSFHGATR
jgi:serine protease